MYSQRMRVHRLEYIVCPHKKIRVIPYITVHHEGDKGSWTSIDLPSHSG